MPERNLLAWTMMISGLAQNGFGEEGLKLFNRMRIEGFEPYDFAFAGEITSCVVLGALEPGCQLRAQLVQLGHDTSLLAGNAIITLYVGCGIVEATNCVFLTMPYLDRVPWNATIAALGQHGHGAPIWKALLAGCWMYGNMDLGIQAAERLFELMPQHDRNYVLLSNIYVTAGRLIDAAKVQKLMGDWGIKKEPGCRWI
nr:pentatricopeptide repeat-containing protein [Quercus suber]